MLGQFARFDLGRSFFQNKDVWQLIKEKLPVSASLGLWTFFISYLVAVPLGIAKAVRAGSRFDFATTLLILVGYAIPGFVLGVALLVIFGGQLQWFPLRGLTSSNWDELSLGARIVDYLWHIALPVTAMVAGSFAITAMLTKNAFLEEIRKQYVLTARAKGLSERQVLYRHVLRNALIPIVTGFPAARSEEHTSELQSPCNLVCRPLLGKKKDKYQAREQRQLEQLRAAPPPAELAALAAAQRARLVAEGQPSNALPIRVRSAV